jgi:hypothetical protein
MSTIKLILHLFVAIMLTIRGDSHKITCNNICQEIEMTMDEGIHQAVVNHFKKGISPSDGICIKGSKYIHDGKFFGFNGQKACVCFVTAPSKYQEGRCEPNQEQCPTYVSGKSGQSVFDYFRYLNENFAKTFNRTDGCCPAGAAKWIQPNASVTGNNVCGCVFPGFDFSSLK